MISHKIQIFTHITTEINTHTTVLSCIIFTYTYNPIQHHATSQASKHVGTRDHNLRECVYACHYIHIKTTSGRLNFSQGDMAGVSLHLLIKKGVLQ